MARARRSSDHWCNAIIDLQLAVARRVILCYVREVAFRRHDYR